MRQEMTKKSKLFYRASLQRLVDERFERNLESKRKHKLKRRLETVRAQSDAAAREQEQIAAERPVVAIRRKLKDEAKRKTARIKERKAYYELAVPETLSLFTEYESTA